MSSTLHAAYYADHLQQQTVEVVENVPLASDTFRLRFVSPEIASRVLPGQFLMLRLADCNDPLIARPLAVYDTVLSADGEPESIDVVYLAKGKLTRRLEKLSPGQQLVVWGPLGNGFEPRATDHLIMVAGGIGQTPFVTLAKEYLGLQSYGSPPREVASANKVTLCYGARSADFLAGVEDFQRLGVDVCLTTDDGSRGEHGLVTDLLLKVLAEAEGTPRIVCCGPEPMMEAVAKIAAEQNVACQVSLETPMACGVGICFTCVAKVCGADGVWDYKRTCVDGPVFDAEKIVW